MGHVKVALLGGGRREVGAHQDEHPTRSQLCVGPQVTLGATGTLPLVTQEAPCPP